MHDPFQTYSGLGPYLGMQSPIGLLSAGMQTPFMNPTAQAINPYTSGIGNNPQQLALASILASQGVNPQILASQGMGQGLGPVGGISPFAVGMQTQPTLGGWQNPLALLALQNPQLNPILIAALLSGSQQNVSPWNPTYGQGQQLGYQPNTLYGQGPVGSPFNQTGFPLAPQSWVGQPGIGFGQPFGQQMNPFAAQFTGRAPQTFGSPFGQSYGGPFGY